MLTAIQKYTERPIGFLGRRLYRNLGYPQSWSWKLKKYGRDVVRSPIDTSISTMSSAVRRLPIAYGLVAATEGVLGVRRNLSWLSFDRPILNRQAQIHQNSLSRASKFNKPYARTTFGEDVYI
jgi:hypothetical protein